MRSFCLILSFSFAFGSFNVEEAYAHAFHVTVTEAEVNHKTGKIELAMRVHPNDLENALRRMSKRRIQLEKEPKIDALITKYLRDSVRLTVPQPKSPSVSKGESKPSRKQVNEATQPNNKTGKTSTSVLAKDQATSKLRWVGKELDVKWAWLYFEIDLPKEGLGKASLSNQVFFELLKDQANTVVLKDGKRKQTLRFHKDKGTLPIRLK